MASTDHQFKVEKFRTERRKDTEVESECKHLIQTFKRFLTQEKETLLRRFKREDTDKNGYISLNSWADIIAKLVFEKTTVSIDVAHIITLKDNLCPCEDQDKTAKYIEMLSSDE